MMNFTGRCGHAWPWANDGIQAITQSAAAMASRKIILVVPGMAIP
jgi:hypothetical protein